MSKRWTRDEELMLLQLADDNKTDDDIAKELNRSIGAIAIRRKVLGAQMVSSGDDSNEVAGRLKITEDDIKDQQVRNEKRNKKVNSLDNKDEVNEITKVRCLLNEALALLDKM